EEQPGTKTSQPDEDETEVAPGGGEHGVDCITAITGGVISFRQAIALQMADNRLDGGAAPQFALDRGRSKPDSVPMTARACFDRNCSMAFLSRWSGVFARNPAYPVKAGNAVPAWLRPAAALCSYGCDSRKREGARGGGVADVGRAWRAHRGVSRSRHHHRSAR